MVASSFFLYAVTAKPCKGGDGGNVGSMPPPYNVRPTPISDHVLIWGAEANALNPVLPKILDSPLIFPSILAGILSSHACIHSVYDLGTAT